MLSPINRKRIKMCERLSGAYSLATNLNLRLEEKILKMTKTDN
jgi:hypothetical protein